VAKFFKKILCPIDFDDASIASLRYARDLARDNDATLYLMHVVFVPVASSGFPLEPYPVISEEPSRVELQKVAHEQLEGNVRYELVIRTGKPADMINQVAQEMDVDLVVMATHGKTGVSRFFLGSVAEHVVRRSTRPVLTVRPKLEAH
jgi:universal stress protein A